MLNLKQLEDCICKAVSGNIGNIKLAPLLRKDQATMRVSQRYMLYYQIMGGSLNDQSTTISCKKPRKVTYEVKFVFNLKDVRNHQTNYECSEALFELIDGLHIGLPFGCLSVVSFTPLEFLDDGAYYEMELTAKVNGFSSTKRNSLTK